MAAASSFSYAQAAKGTVQPTESSSTTPQPSADKASSAPAANGETQQPAAAPQQSESSDAPAVENGSSNAESRPTETATQDAESPAVSAPAETPAAVDGPVEAKTETAQTSSRRPEPKKDEDAARLDRPWRRNDKSTRSSSAATRSVDEHDSRKPRKGKKTRSSDAAGADSASSVADQDTKDEPEPPKVELSEAPLPAVNIWQQRKQAQAAKAKPEPATNGVSAAEGQQKPAAAHLNGAPAPAKGAQPKSGDKPERNGTRGNRAPGGRGPKEARTDAPPLVEDAAAWPTPETAIQEDSKKKTSADKPADAEDASQGKPRQKKEWVTYDYVPSVNFETQLPQMRGSKPRGGAKGAAGSRSAINAQNNAATNGDKAGPAAASAANPAANKSESRDRARESGGPAAGRNTSLPPNGTNKRASMDVANAKGEQQKKTGENGSAKAGRDAAAPQNQNHHAPHPVREGRSERGRGGYRGRGGGMNPHGQHGHAAASSMGAAPPFQPGAGNNGMARGPYSPPPRQGQGNVFIPGSQRGGGRGGRGGANYNNRMSMPNGGPRMPHGAPPQQQQQQQQLPQAFTPTAYEFPNPMHHHMGAPGMPYAPFYDQTSMVAPMVRQQVEYYFSIENLVKDTFLRQHMDSQGFVPLSLILTFRRMRELSVDLGLARAVCEELPDVDVVVSDDDGVDRVRRRHGWEAFLLPMDQRDESARNDGPKRLTWKSRNYGYAPAPQFNGMPYGMMSPSMYAPPFEEQHQVPHVNGYVNGNGHAHGGSQLSAAVPDFAPSGALEAVQTNGLVNGHADKDDQN